MNGQRIKMLDFTEMMEFRGGTYYPVPSTNPIMKGIGKEVRGNAKE